MTRLMIWHDVAGKACASASRAFQPRGDGRMEWICEHGVGHPVGVIPQVAWQEWMGVHGCDGCCQGEPWRALLTDSYAQCRSGWRDSGWASLVLPLIDRAEAEGIAIVQIKEKFGTLRFYHGQPWDSPFSLAVREAEAQSEVTCEDCGALGRRCQPRHWIRTLCPGCEATTKARYDREDKELREWKAKKAPKGATKEHG